MLSSFLSPQVLSITAIRTQLEIAAAEAEEESEVRYVSRTEDEFEIKGAMSRYFSIF